MPNVRDKPLYFCHSFGRGFARVLANLMCEAGFMARGEVANTKV